MWHRTKMIRQAVLIFVLFAQSVFCADCGVSLFNNGSTVIENTSCDTKAIINEGSYGRLSFSGDMGSGSIRVQNGEWDLSISTPSILYSAHNVAISIQNAKKLTIELEIFAIPNIVTEPHPIQHGQATVFTTSQMKGRKMAFTLNNARVRLNGAANPVNKLALTGSFVFGNDPSVPYTSLYSASTGYALSRNGSITILTVSQETYTDSIAMLLAEADVNEYSTVSLVHSYDYTDPTQKYYKIDLINGAQSPAALIVYSPSNGPVSVNRISMIQDSAYVDTYAGGLPIADKNFYHLEKYMGTPQQLQMSLPQCFFGQFTTFLANYPALIYADNDETVNFNSCSRVLSNGDCGFVMSRNFGFAGNQELNIGFNIDTVTNGTVDFVARSMDNGTSVTVAAYQNGVIQTEVIDWRNTSNIFDSLSATSFTVKFTSPSYSRGGVLNYCALAQGSSNSTISTTSHPASSPGTNVTISKSTLPTNPPSNGTTTTLPTTTKSALSYGALLAVIGFSSVLLV